MLRRPTLTVAILAVLLSLTGCVQRVYEIRISPRADGEGWDRVLTVTENRTEKGAEGKDVPKQDRRVAPTTFTRDIASDMGNAGSITTYATSLGTLSIYSERFRGQSAVATAMEARLLAASEAARLLGGWLMSESANWPGAANLASWSEHELASDMRDLAVHVWLTGVDRSGTRDPAHSAGWLRVTQFLTERGYLEPGELSQITRLLMGGAETESTHRWFIRMIARKAGDAAMVGGGDPPPFLRSWQASSESLENYLRQQPEFGVLEAQLASEAKLNQQQPLVDPKQVLGDYLHAMVDGMVPIFANEAGLWSETLDLQVTVPVEPFATNGRWRADVGAVRWVTMVDGPDEESMYPFNAYAQWVVPNDAAQQRTLGSIAIRGVNLAKYCLWRTGLTEAEGQAWDDALASLHPEMDAPGHLEAAGSRSGIPQPLLDSGINLIREGIRPAAKQK